MVWAGRRRQTEAVSHGECFSDHVRKRLGLTAKDVSDEDVMAFVAEATA